MNLPLHGGPPPRFSPDLASYQRFSPMTPGYHQEAGERLRHPLYRGQQPDQAELHRGQLHPQLPPDQWGWQRDQMQRYIIKGGHGTRDMGHVRPPVSRYHQQPPRGQQTSVIRNRFVNSDHSVHVNSEPGHVANRDSRHVYEAENYRADIKQEAASSSCSSDDDQQLIPQTVTSSHLQMNHSERQPTKVVFSTNEIPEYPSPYLNNRQESADRVRDDDFKR